MKYMIMTFGDESACDTLGLGGSGATWSKEEVAEHVRGMSAFYADLAARRTLSTPERRYLLRRASGLDQPL